MTEYEVQANEFLKKAGAHMTISRVGEVEGFPFDEHDTLWHYKYQITLTRNKKQYRFTFYDSFYNWKENRRPTRYDVLACIEKYEVPSTTEDFADEMGMHIDDQHQYKRAEKIRAACQKQYEKLLWLFGEELMEDLREIC